MYESAKLSPGAPAIYVAGPFSQGKLTRNLHQAIEAANRLFDHGFVPIVPHFTFFLEMAGPDRPYEDWITLGVETMRHCDAIVRLPGLSHGADLEVEQAMEWGMPVFELEELLSIGPKADIFQGEL